MTQLMALPNAWIDRLFDRLAAIYGKHWIDLWADVPMADVKDAWAEGLRGCDGDQIKAGLNHAMLNLKFPPTLPEFVTLCHAFRKAVEPVPQLAGPPASADQVARVTALAGTVGKPKEDSRKWARRIMERQKSGDYPYVYGLQCAKEAIGLTEGT